MHAEQRVPSGNNALWRRTRLFILKEGESRQQLPPPAASVKFQVLLRPPRVRYERIWPASADGRTTTFAPKETRE
jgi:hypothetical protein